ncbi:hepatitis A virus cellular receptor 1 homolog [Dendropsophus ebraccatus]|uniref:hepatitis A virus cellular receptor 1 homolog n=1 Tax=Dendropsophus ebraccatus TaxID=150705 RepID=UPI0038311AA0
MSHLNTLRILVLVICSTDLVAAAKRVTGPLNGRVTLPCTYTGWKTTMCWGRGHCPSSKCYDVIIWTNGDKVTWRKSDRYQLLGDIGQRDVSLTITGVTKQDEGTYCCKIEIPGWNNDLRIEYTVQIREGPEVTEPTTDRSTGVSNIVPSTTEGMTVTDSVDSGEQNIPPIANTIRGIIIVLFPAFFLLIYKCCSLQL